VGVDACNDFAMRVCSSLLPAAAGALAGAATVAFVRPARVPADLRAPMLEAAEGFVIAGIDAADRVEDAIEGQKAGRADLADLIPHM
jgi:hypothetical protein